MSEINSYNMRIGSNIVPRPPLVGTKNVFQCISPLPPPWSGNEKMICNIRSKLFPVGKKTRQEQCWAMTIYLFSTFFPIHNHTVFLHV